jgi:hypothetical protein
LAPAPAGDRVSYRRSGVDEWYENGPAGLEQGFTLLRRPVGRGPLILAVATIPDGARVRVAKSGHSAAVSGARLAPVLEYGDLAVRDAHGRRLPARMLVAGRSLLIRVADAQAAYPLTIDPLTQTTELTAADGQANDRLGSSVALSGTTAVASASNGMYIFTETPTGAWRQAAGVCRMRWRREPGFWLRRDLWSHDRGTVRRRGGRLHAGRRWQLAAGRHAERPGAWRHRLGGDLGRHDRRWRARDKRLPGSGLRIHAASRV